MQWYSAPTQGGDIRLLSPSVVSTQKRVLTIFLKKGENQKERNNK